MSARYLGSVRVERCGWQGLRAHRDHEQRKRNVQHVEPALTPKNRVLVGSGDAVVDAEAHIAGARAKIRKGVAEPFIVGVVTTSPGWFDGGDRDGRARHWAEHGLAFLRERFGDDLVAASLHLDETTPHLHVAIVPLHRWKTRRGRTRVEVSPRQALRGKEALSRLQDDLARHLAPLGIERGERGAARRHERPKRFLERAAREAEVSLDVARAALADAERAEREIAARERDLARREREQAALVRAKAEAATKAERERLAKVQREAEAFTAGVTAFVNGDIVDASQDAEGRKLLHLHPNLAAAIRDVLLRDLAPAWGAVWAWVRDQVQALRARRRAAEAEGRDEARRKARAEVSNESAAAKRVLDLAGSALARLDGIPQRPVRERAAIETARREHRLAQIADRDLGER